MTKSKTTAANLLNDAFGKNAFETTGRDYYFLYFISILIYRLTLII